MSLIEDDRTTSAEPPPDRGGRGFYRPKAWGFWGLGPVGSVICIVAAFGCIVGVTSPYPVLAPAVVLGLTAICLYFASVPDRHGKSGLQRRTPRWSWLRARRANELTYTPGTLTHMGAHRLPGALASSELAEYTTDAGDSFAVLRYPSTRLYVVSVDCQPDGASLLDPTDVDGQVEKFGHWLGSLAQEPDFIQGIVTIETSADAGPTLQAGIRSRQSDRAHSLSKELMGALLQQYPQGSQGVTVSVTATFQAPPPVVGLDGKKVKTKDPDAEARQVGELLAIRMNHLFADLPECGSGTITPLSCDDVIERVRCAYNPADRRIYADARAKGQSRPVSLWTSAGPAGSQNHWNWYEHGGGGSVTWEFTGFTSQVIHPDGLLPLLETGGKDSSTRISLIYRPLTPEKGSAAVERNYYAAKSRRQDASRPSAAHTQAMGDADRARHAASAGHAVMDLAITVTTTVEDPQKHLPRAKAAVQRLAPNARLQLRQTDGLHDVMFAQGVGVLGFVADKHLRLPPALTNGV